MKKLFIILSISILAASCTSDSVENDFRESVVPQKPTPEAPQPPEPDTVESPGTVIEEVIVPMGSFSYQGEIPGATSKIPTCKNDTPTDANFVFVGPEGNTIERKKPITEINGSWVSEPDSLKVGEYELMELFLTSQNDTVYALPTQEDEQFLPFADTVLPMPLTISEAETVIGGTALCYVPPVLVVTDEIQGDIKTLEITFVNIYVTRAADGDSDCIDTITLDLYANGNTEPVEIYRNEDETDIRRSGGIAAPVTRLMDSIQVKAWSKRISDDEFDGLPMVREIKTYTPETLPEEAIGDVVLFRYSCN